jgi:hypothetical protein
VTIWSALVMLLALRSALDKPQTEAMMARMNLTD